MQSRLRRPYFESRLRFPFGQVTQNLASHSPFERCMTVPVPLAAFDVDKLFASPHLSAYPFLQGCCRDYESAADPQMRK